MTQQASQPPRRHQTMVLRECCVCQSSIYPDEKTTTCPRCGLTFHAECWEVNLGCAAYGCDQVDVLKPKAEPVVEQLPPPVEQPIERLPWDFALLGAGTIALMLSTLTFGLPSLAVTVAVVIRVIRARSVRPPIRLAALVIGIIGIAVGVEISRFWWLRDYTAAG